MGQYTVHYTVHYTLQYTVQYTVHYTVHYTIFGTVPRLYYTKMTAHNADTHTQYVSVVEGLVLDVWMVFVFVFVFVSLLYLYLYLFRHWKTQYVLVCYSRVETSPVNNVN